MNQDVKARWLHKLETEDIPQLTGYLGNAQGARCCLGVLCDIAVEDGIIDAPRVTHLRPGSETYIYGLDQLATLPHEVMEWAGLDSTNGGYSNNDPAKYGYDRALSDDNDSGMPFSEIAKIIREKF